MVVEQNERAEHPAPLRAIPDEAVVYLDVRPILRAGGEPFGEILAARGRVTTGGALCIRAIFEPVPLYTVMARQGLDHHTERLADDDWRVWFYPPADEAATDTKAGAGATSGEVRSGEATSAAPISVERASDERASGEGASEEVADDIVVLDVRGLEPPEPMARTLARLETLAPGQTLLQLNVRVPQFLLPMLEDRGFVYEIREQSPELVRVFIRRAP